MATLAPGILVKLLNAMSTGTKATGEHRSAVLQVADIVPVDLDEKDLWPKHGFYIKVSDSSHSIYVSLPFEQDDLVLSNKMQLGQFIYVEKLEPGSPVPTLKGTKLLPGRHPLVGTPEPIIGIRGRGDKSEPRSHNSRISTRRRRGSWGAEPNSIDAISSPAIVKPLLLDFDKSTPKKERSGSARTGKIWATPIREKKGNESDSAMSYRSSMGGFLLSKMMADAKEETPVAVRKSCAGPPSAMKNPRRKSVGEREQRIPECPFNSAERKSSTSPPSSRNARLNSSNLSGKVEGNPPNSGFAPSHTLQPCVNSSNIDSTSSGSQLMSLPGKLGAIGKEVFQQREMVQKIAIQALRDASATENLVRVLRMFSELRSSAKADAPAACLERFLNFHLQVVQAVKDMESIQAAAEVTQAAAAKQDQPLKERAEKDSSLNESAKNSDEQNGNPSSSAPPRRTAAALSRSVTFAGEGRKNQRSKQTLKTEGDENKRPLAPAAASNFNNAINWGKQIELEAKNWFMEFLEEALEKGLKKRKESATADAGKKTPGCCPQSVLLKVVNWIEVEQSDNGGKRLVHPRAAEIARKLRIKVKNP